MSVFVNFNANFRGDTAHIGYGEGGDEPLLAALHEGAEAEIRAAAIEVLQQVAQ